MNGIVFFTYGRAATCNNNCQKHTSVCWKTNASPAWSIRIEIPFFNKRRHDRDSFLFLYNDVMVRISAGTWIRVFFGRKGK